MTKTSGDLLDVDITGFAHGGTGIARHDGRVIFVSDAIPGERVRVRLLDGSTDKKSFWRAVAVSVREESPHRRAHVWAEADIDRDPQSRPGGADLGHIELAHQRVLKKQVLHEALEKFAPGVTEAPDVAALDDTDGTGWRTRVTLHVDEQGNVGPYAARSHRVVPVKSHPLARPAVREAIANLKEQKQGRVEIVEPSTGRVRILSLPDAGKRAKSAVIRERVGEREFQLDSRGFWQVHPKAATTLDATVRAALADAVDPERTHLDLYGGVGLFTATLADLGARRLVSVEAHKSAAEYVRMNLAPAKVDAVTARVERYVDGLEADGSYGAVVLDPPRQGAGAQVVRALDRVNPDRIVYVACDPVALARDLALFAELGWSVPELQAFDLFPHSHHFECVATLTR